MARQRGRRRTVCSADGAARRGLALGLLCLLSQAQPVVAQTEGLPPAVQFITIVLLVAFSGLFSGLTLGLLGLDKMGLQIVIGGGEPERAKLAKKLLPLREDGNLLLCTLLLGNVAVNALLSILMANLTNGLVGFLLSTAIIVIFGEIIPQASCSRHALYLGAKAVPIVVVLKWIIFPLAKPFAMALDYALGEELGTIFSHAELTEMVVLHVREHAMDEETGLAIKGALNYKQMKASEVMTPLDTVFMLSADDVLSYQTIANIFKAGFSRIPVYKDSKQNIVGLLYAKDLIFIDPEDKTPIRNFTAVFGRPVTKVFSWTELGECMQVFRGGKGHMALVVDVMEGDDDDAEGDPTYALVGVITLEDIVEEIIGEEIVDEYDTWNDNQHSKVVVRDKQVDAARLRVLHSHSQAFDDHQLSFEQRKAITAHFMANVEQIKSHPMAPIPEGAIARLVRLAHVFTVRRVAKPDSDEPESADIIYMRGRPSSLCTLVLDGRLVVKAGKDGFRSDAGPWSIIGADALLIEGENYVPDYTCFVASGTAKLLQCTFEMLQIAIDPKSDNENESDRDHASRLGGNRPQRVRRRRENRRRKIDALRESLKNDQQSGNETDTSIDEAGPMTQGSNEDKRRSFLELLAGNSSSTPSQWTNVLGGEREEDDAKL